MVVITIIGILSSLAYSSLIDLIFTNRAKETAQVMRAFAERALMEAKRQNAIVELSLSSNSMKADLIELDNDGTDNVISTIVQPLSDGFLAKDEGSPVAGLAIFTSNVIRADPLIGISGIVEEGYFSACGAKGYCGAAVKTKDKNSFTAYIKKKDSWEAL